MKHSQFARFCTHRGDLERISSNLRWTLNVFDLAHPNWQGTDSRCGNRLFCICRGTGTLRNVRNGKRMEFRPGYAYFIPRNLLVELCFPPELVFYALEFQVELLPGLDLFRANDSVLEYKPEPEMFEKLGHIYNGEVTWRNLFEFEELRQQIILGILDKVEPCISCADMHQGLIKYARLIDYIRNEASAQTTMEKLAKVQHCSYDKLSRIFRSDFNMTLKEMLDAELSARAKMLLTSTDFSVKEIAYRLGFSTEYNFSRFFKRLNLCSPRSYRLRRLFAGPFPIRQKNAAAGVRFRGVGKSDAPQ